VILDKRGRPDAPVARHWHETEDEFIVVLSGVPVLVEDEETVTPSRRSI